MYILRTTFQPAIRKHSYDSARVAGLLLSGIGSLLWVDLEPVKNNTLLSTWLCLSPWFSFGNNNFEVSFITPWTLKILHILEIVLSLHWHGSLKASKQRKKTMLSSQINGRAKPQSSGAFWLPLAMPWGWMIYDSDRSCQGKIKGHTLRSLLQGTWNHLLPLTASWIQFWILEQGNY